MSILKFHYLLLFYLSFYSFVIWNLVLTIFNEDAFFFKLSLYDKALKLFKFDCEITLESVPGTNQY